MRFLQKQSHYFSNDQRNIVTTGNKQSFNHLKVSTESAALRSTHCVRRIGVIAAITRQIGRNASAVRRPRVGRNAANILTVIVGRIVGRATAARRPHLL